MAGKRSLDDDDSLEVNLVKKSKTDDFLSSYNNTHRLNDAKKWELLPSIVYQLLTLFKKSEKLSTDDSDSKMNLVKTIFFVIN